MASTVGSAPRTAEQRRDHEVPLWRLYLLRAVPVLAIPWGLGLLEKVIWAAPTERGMVDSLLTGLFLMTLLAIRYPLQMLPIYLFEFVWKMVWLLAFGLPQWLGGHIDAQLSKDLWQIGAFPVVMAIVIPWGYVWRHYVKKPGDRWTPSGR